LNRIAYLLPALSLILLVGLSNAQTLPSGTVYYQNISIGSWSSVASRYVQQMINITEANYTSGVLVYNGTTANFEFTYANGTVVPAWIEANNSGVLTTWVNITNTTSNIYLDFFNTTTNTLSSSGTTGIGEAPQLSSTYAEYDDGASVFTQYGGKSWSSFTLLGSYWSTANGYLQWTNSSASSTGPAALIESANYSATGQYIISMAFNYTTTASSITGIMAVATPNGTQAAGYRFVGSKNGGNNWISFLSDSVTWVLAGSYAGATNTPYTLSVINNGGSWSGYLYNGYSTTGSVLTSFGPTSYSAANYFGKTSGYVGIGISYFKGSGSVTPLNVMWFYMRAYPPNGVMPSVSFGTLTPA